MKALAFIILHISTASSAAPEVQPIGYGSSTSVINEKILEGFFSGFELGFGSTLEPMRPKSQYLKVEQNREGSPLSAVRAAQKLIESNVSSLFGFPGSTDALLAAKVASVSGMLSVFPGCNHNGLAEFGKTVFSTGHSSDDEVFAQLELASRVLKFRKGLAIINPMAAPSAVLEKIYTTETAKKKFPGLIVETTRIKADNSLEASAIEGIQRGKYDFLIFTPYPEASVQFVDQLMKLSSDIPVIAGSAWGTVDSDVMRRFVSTKKAPFYMQTSWLVESNAGKRFRKIFKKTYAKEPTAESAYGYDLGVIAATTTNRVKGPVTKQSILEAFHSDLCFANLSVGNLCFNPKGGHAKRGIHFLRFTKNGFKPAFESGM